MVEPSPQTWTLRLKAHKTTVLLHVDPLHTFSFIKSQLYDALKDTGLKHPKTHESILLPDSPDNIQFGRPVDLLNPQQGFQLADWEIPAVESEEDTGKGKGKAKAGKGASGGAKSGIADCPKGAGLKNGAVLAFRWVGDGAWDGDDDEAFEDGANMWGVQLASFEDAYGVENQSDVGGGREFEG
ncbi:hypothetical protein CC86DRAFT_81097 [Ophiobolus disseminans]|uniref:Uncharacterized protein n=1 Tax=Ophiobolus disseminans TaxID=1469910 RepID=A0A6A6ZQE5_9PLEO|nr:hypothetical protein CC86DRAFT_81097 [Ophiobolus disseminans]